MDGQGGQFTSVEIKILALHTLQLYRMSFNANDLHLLGLISHLVDSPGHPYVSEQHRKADYNLSSGSTIRCQQILTPYFD